MKKNRDLPVESFIGIKVCPFCGKIFESNEKTCKNCSGRKNLFSQKDELEVSYSSKFFEETGSFETTLSITRKENDKIVFQRTLFDEKARMLYKYLTEPGS